MDATRPVAGNGPRAANLGPCQRRTFLALPPYCVPATDEVGRFHASTPVFPDFADEVVPLHHLILLNLRPAPAVRRHAPVAEVIEVGVPLPCVLDLWERFEPVPDGRLDAALLVELLRIALSLSSRGNHPPGLDSVGDAEIWYRSSRPLRTGLAGVVIASVATSSRGIYPTGTFFSECGVTNQVEESLAGSSVECPDAPVAIKSQSILFTSDSYSSQ